MQAKTPSLAPPESSLFGSLLLVDCHGGFNLSDSVVNEGSSFLEGE